MIADASIEGLDLLTRMATVAAKRAGTQLAGPVRLAGCDAFELRPGYAPDGVALESWPVRTDGRAITVSVFATAPQAGGGERMAGTGRFTFTLLPAGSKESSA